MLCCIWTHYIITHYTVGWIAVSCMLKMTTHSKRGTYKMMHIATAKNIQHIGTFVYMAVLTMLYGMLEMLRVLCMYSLWPANASAYVDMLLHKHCKTWYMYSVYGIDTVCMACVLMDTTPDKAVHMLVELTNDTDTPVLQALTCNTGTNTTRILSHYMLLFVLLPITAAMTMAQLYADEHSYTNTLVMMVWYTYAMPSLEYIYTETVHKCIVLAHASKTKMNLQWAEQYLAHYQL